VPGARAEAAASPAPPGPAPSSAGAKGASAVYLEYRAALERAGGVKDLLPYLQKSRREFLALGTDEELAAWLKTVRPARAQAGQRVVAEKPFDQGVVLSTQGSAPTGQALLGRVEMRREGAGFVVGEETWYPRLEPLGKLPPSAHDFAKGTFRVNDKTVALAY